MRRASLLFVLACRAPISAPPDLIADAGLPDCCPMDQWTDACACGFFGFPDGGTATSSWVLESPSNDLWADLADADWHLLPDDTREVVRANHEMTELWVHVDHAKVHLIHDDGGVAAAPRRGQLWEWLAARPYLQNHGDIVRTTEAVDAIADAVEGELEDYRWAATLDIMAAYETGYRPDICGGCPGIPNGTACTREQGAESCGAWATERGRTPRGSTIRDQARIALTMLKESESWCPTHPLAMYAGIGHRTPDGVWHPECRAIPLTDFRLRQINRELGRTP
jgi:hypothetical protein